MVLRVELEVPVLTERAEEEPMAGQMVVMGTRLLRLGEPTALATAAGMPPLALV
jgi:hypothetical protein